MGILDGIVDWLATQVMNFLDLASTSVLGALGCNMDTFKRYFPAASSMYEIFIWTAIGLVLLNLVWQLYHQPQRFGHCLFLRHSDSGSGGRHSH